MSVAGPRHPLEDFVLEAENLFHSLLVDIDSTQHLDLFSNRVSAEKRRTEIQATNFDSSNVISPTQRSTPVITTDIDDASSFNLSELFDHYTSDSVILPPQPWLSVDTASLSRSPSTSSEGSSRQSEHITSSQNVGSVGSVEARSALEAISDLVSGLTESQIAGPQSVADESESLPSGDSSNYNLTTSDEVAEAPAENEEPLVAVPEVQEPSIDEDALVLFWDRVEEERSAYLDSLPILPPRPTLVTPNVQSSSNPGPSRGKSQKRLPKWLNLKRKSTKTPLSPLEGVVEGEISNGALPEATCGICFDSFTVLEKPASHVTAHPRAANQTNRVGMLLPCAGEHQYCMDCLSEYIKVTLKKGKKARSVFPIRCPECPIETWQMTEEVAEMFLSEELLDMWRRQARLELVEQVECPYEGCSASFEWTKTFPAPKLITCPECNRSLCLSCRTAPHPALTCEENMTDSNDAAIYEIARVMGWKRCQMCKMVVERVSGCPHMTCICGNEFCYRCGSLYRGGCTQGALCSSQVDLTLFEPTPPVSTSRRIYRRTFGWIRRISRILLVRR
ncbi:hypothetical protein FRC03_001818 [Tulasnella sp. 419]|nr:hypothetical protein FRC03_001818 [Tulasnella sp. 419]